MMGAEYSEITKNQVFSGQIQGGFSQNYMVHCAFGLLRANRSASCLIVPKIGDKVLLVAVDNELYILSVLTTADNRGVELASDGDLTIRANNGTVAVAAENIDLLASNRQHIVSPQLVVTAGKGQVHCQHASIQGEKLVARWGQAEWLIEKLSTIVNHLHEHYQHVFRRVDGVDKTSSNQSFHNVDKCLSIRAEHANITTRKDMKIDGERIHMG